MGAENSREQREREQAIKNEANYALERQRRLYEQQCKALNQALERQQSAYLELKKKEEIQNEVQRLLKEQQQNQAKTVADQQTLPNKLTPSAPPVDSYPSTSFKPQTVQQTCPTSQFSNLQVNPHNLTHTNFKPEPPISHGPPIFQSQMQTQQYLSAAPQPLLPTPQAGSSNFYPQIPVSAPLKLQSQISNPQFQCENQMSANHTRTLSPSPTNTISSNLYTQNLAKSDVNQNKVSPGWNLTESFYDRHNKNFNGGVKNDVDNDFRSMENPKVYPNLQKSNPFEIRSSAVIVNKDVPNIKNTRNTDSYDNNNVQAQGTSNTPATAGGIRSASRPRRRPTKNDRLGKKNEKEDDNDVSCCTCDNKLGLYIYQCDQGHSSCKDCKLRGFSCGKCSSSIKDLRNFPLEAYIAELVRPCPNASEGCNREHKVKEMDEHLKSCPFKEVLCPLSNVYHECYWIGKISEIRTHFTDQHPEHYKEGVGKEFTIKDISIGTHSVNLVTIGPYNFLVHSKVTNEHICFAVQLLSTQSIALKWTYQFDLYNKSKPLQKYEYTDACQSANINIEQIFGTSKCATIPIGYAETFRNKEGTFNYKFFITKEPNKKKIENRRGNNNWKRNTNDNFVFV